MKVEHPKLSQEDNQSTIRDVHFREYNALRAEALQSMENRNQIINFGMAVVGGLILAALTSDARTTEFVQLMFDLVIPLVCVLVYVNWLGEFERMVRAGRYLKDLEDLINKTLRSRILAWQHDVRNMRMGYSYLVIAALFLGLAGVSPWLGNSTKVPVRPNWDLLWPLPFDGLSFINSAWPAVLADVVAIAITIWRIKRIKTYKRAV